MKMEKVRLRRKSGAWRTITKANWDYNEPWRIADVLCIFFLFLEHIAEVKASGGQVEEETQQFMIPPDNLMGRRMSCF